MTLLDKDRLIMERVALEPPIPPPARPVRWIAWTFSILVVAAAAIAALVIASGSDGVTVDEAGSGAAYGAIHEPGYEAPTRWVGESDMTLEEYEALRAATVALAESDPYLARFMPGSGFGYAPPVTGTIGEMDTYLERFLPGSGFTWEPPSRG